MAWGTVQGHPFYPRHCCYGLPCLGPLLSPFPMYVSGGPRTAHTLVWELGLDIPRACPALPDPGQKGQGHHKSEGPKCRSRPPDLTLLRASTLVFRPVLDVMAHVGATQARIDIFREIFLRQTTISCPLMPQGPYPKEERSLCRPEPPLTIASAGAVWLMGHLSQQIV